MAADGPFYRKPLCGIDTIATGELWTIRVVSLIESYCTSLYNDGFDEQSVAGRSGHRSTILR